MTRPARVGLSKRLTVALLASAIVLASPAFAFPSVATQSSGWTIVSVNWGTPNAPVEAAPGSSNDPLVVTLQYYYANTANGVTVTLDLPPGFTDSNGNQVTTAYIPGNVPSGSVLPLTFYLTISSAVSLGTYHIPMNVTWGAFTPFYSVNVWQGLNAYVPLKGKVQLQFSSLNPELAPGGVTIVPILVNNTGSGSATNVTLTFSASSGALSSPPVTVLSAPATIDSLPAHSWVTSEVKVYTLAAAAGQSVTLIASATYTDAYGYAVPAIGQIGLYVFSGSSGSSVGLSGYSYQPTLIYPGTTQAALQVVLVNLGTSPAFNVNVTLIPSSPVYAITAGSLSRSFSQLPAGQSTPVSFVFGVTNSSAAENTTLSLLVQSPPSVQLKFSIPYNEQPKANLVIVSSKFPSISTGDGADQVTITVKNTGGAAAQSATFVLQPSDIFEPSTQGSFSTPLSSGAGTIPPGAEANLTVVLQVNPNIVGGEYPLVFHVTWGQLGAGAPFGQDISLMVPVQASVFQSVNGVILSWPFLVALVVILLALFLVRRSRRRARSVQEGQPETAK